MENNNIISEENLEKLVMMEGEKTDNLEVIPKENVINKLNFAYNMDTPIPGKNPEDKFDSILDNMNKETALDDLVKKSAIIKGNAEKNKPDAAAMKKQFVESMLYSQGEQFFEKHHYMMDSQTKRRIRRKIEKDYDAGKFTNKNTLN